MEKCDCEYAVQAVVARRQRKGRMEYRIRWEGYGSGEDTWEPESNLMCPGRLAEWEAANGKKQGRSTKKKKQATRDEDKTTSRPSKKAKPISTQPSSARIADGPRTRRVPYQVKHCSNRKYGLGVFAKVAIPAGTFLFECTGKRLRTKKQIQSSESSIRYHYQLSDGTVLDMSEGGNAACRLNHFEGIGERASVEAKEKLRGGELHVQLFTCVDVAPGEELLLNYGPQYVGFDWELETGGKRKKSTKGGLQVGRLCEHNIVRSQCKVCVGGAICEHHRRRYSCKECGGGRICQHNRVRYTCKDCGGGGICEHNRVRYTCKECGGNGICKHNRMRYRCKECGRNRITL